MSENQPNDSQRHGQMYDPFLDRIILVPLDPARVYIFLAGLIVGVKDQPPPTPK